MATNVSSAKEELQKVVDKVVVFSPCSKSKCDEIDIPPDFKPKDPEDYLESLALVCKLINTRQEVLNDPRAQKGTKPTLVFDLYVKAKNSKAYKGIRESCYEDLREKLLSSDDIQWFFLSGGYGVIHALERAKRYDATFHSTRIDRIWHEAGLPLICDSIVRKFNPSRLYIFGTPKYLDFIKEANFYRETMDSGVTKVFEGFQEPQDSNAGLRWLSERLRKFAKAVISNDLSSFDSAYPEKYYSNKEQADSNNAC